MTDTVARSTRREFLPFNPPLIEEEEIQEVVANQIRALANKSSLGLAIRRGPARVERDSNG